MPEAIGAAVDAAAHVRQEVANRGALARDLLARVHGEPEERRALHRDALLGALGRELLLRHAHDLGELGLGRLAALGARPRARGHVGDEGVAAGEDVAAEPRLDLGEHSGVRLQQGPRSGEV